MLLFLFKVFQAWSFAEVVFRCNLSFMSQWLPFELNRFTLVPEWGAPAQTLQNLNVSLALSVERQLSTQYSDGRWHDEGHPGDNGGGGHLSLWYICEGTCSTLKVPQGANNLEFGKSCYTFNKECRNWPDAKRDCEQAGGQLVSITSSAENVWLQGQAARHGFHIGLSYTSTNGWKWEDGTTLGFPPAYSNQWTHWDSGEPNPGSSSYSPNYAFMNYWGNLGMEHDCWTEESEEWREEFLIYGAIGLVGFLVVGAIAYFLGGCCYKSKSVDRRERPFPDSTSNGINPYGLGGASDFAIQYCSCFDDCGACLHGFFCHECRAGDTHDITEIGGYWCTVMGLYAIAMTVTGIDGLVSITTGMDPNMRSWVGNLIIGVWMCQRKQRLRARLGGSMQHPNQFMDFCCWWCCSCLAIIQEARTVDAIQGVHQECCCSLVPGIHPSTTRYAKQQPAVVGSAVAVGQVIGQPVQPGGPVMGTVVVADTKEGVETNNEKPA